MCPTPLAEGSLVPLLVSSVVNIMCPVGLSLPRCVTVVPEALEPLCLVEKRTEHSTPVDVRTSTGNTASLPLTKPTVTTTVPCVGVEGRRSFSEVLSYLCTWRV